MSPFNIDQGLLDETSAIQLFAAAQLSQLTGTFSFQRENVTKWIIFSRGRVVGARSSQIGESLGRLLVAWGWISQDAYMKSLERMDEGKEKHGQILASMGALDQNRIPEALRRQNAVRLADCVSWEAGRYTFAAGEVPEREPFPLWKVFQEGLYKRYGREGLSKQAMQFKGAVPKRTGGLFEALISQTPEALPLYNKLDGKKTLAELGKNEANQLAFFCAVLVLAELGIIEIAEAPAEDPLEKAFRRARQLGPSDLLQISPTAPADEIHAATGRLLARFATEKNSQSRFFQPLVSLIEEAGQKLIHAAKDPVKAEESMPLQAEKAFQLGLEHMAKRQIQLAIHKFEEASFFAPAAAEVKGYLAWARFLASPTDENRLHTGLAAMEAAVAADPHDPELHAFHGALLKLVGKLVESEAALIRAIELDATNVLAKRELEGVRMRLGRQGDRNSVNLNSVMSDARIVLQRWIGGNGIISNFKHDEVRIGSGVKDDLVVSEAVLPQITPAHCTVVRQGDRYFARRNGSAGIVLVNGRMLQAREEVRLTAADRVVLGSPENGPVLEFRVLDPDFLTKLRGSSAKRQQQEDNSDFWVG